MPKFAVYYIPQADDPFYRLGSQLLGYDTRSRNSLPLPSDTREALGQFDATWTTISQPYGFHLTISEAIDCHWAKLPSLAHDLADLLACFDPAYPFTLQQHSEHSVGIWGEQGKHSLVLLYEPNEHLRMLHTLLVARLNPQGTGSSYLKKHCTQPETELPPHELQQLRLFYSPKIFSNWYPHFTLFNPYTGTDATLMASRLAHLFAPYKQITINTLCLLVQPNDQANWHIYQEFHR